MRPVLASPDLDKEFRVEADASNYATGGVLSMKCSNELWRPVAFISVTNFIWSYLHQFFDDSHSLKTCLKPLKKSFDYYQLCLKAINNGRDIRQINW